jgi:type II secretory pathway pseudopilin PulG
MPVNARDERGFTMIAAVTGMSLVATLALVAVAAVSGDINLTRGDLDRRQAYEAAKAGINEYAFHLHADNSYWTGCTDVPEPHAVNQDGDVPLKKRDVPGHTGAKYAIELLPATGEEECDSTSVETATESMLEPSGAMRGTFRIRSTGFAGKSEVAIVATFRPVTFLDYVYFTEYETSDPVSYGFPNPSPQLEGANTQCATTLQARDEQGNALSLSVAGRNSAPFYSKFNPSTGKTEKKYCRVISFVTGDFLNGPVHTNDTFAICGSPWFGRPEKNDAIEVGALSPGWYSTSKVPNSGSSCSGSPNFTSTLRINSPALSPPPTNAELKNIVEPEFKFKGQVRICLSGNSMTVGNNGTCSGVYSGSIPANGVVYVESDVCSEAYSPFTAAYPATSGCGNAYIHGEYTGQLTVAAENDIVIDGDLVRDNESGVLGLIANNFVRIYHGHSGQVINPTTFDPECKSGTESGLGDVAIDAAILAINHSFIVDHYDCGTSQGTLTVRGAIAQKFRGAVGTTGGNTGYLKSYNYDDRLRFLTPPSFIKPEQSVDWTIGRETIE